MSGPTLEWKGDGYPGTAWNHEAGTLNAWVRRAVSGWNRHVWYVYRDGRACARGRCATEAEAFEAAERALAKLGVCRCFTTGTSYGHCRYHGETSEART